MQENSLIQYFYEGMSFLDKHWADATSGGSLLDKMPQVARELIKDQVNYMHKLWSTCIM